MMGFSKNNEETSGTSKTNDVTELQLTKAYAIIKLLGFKLPLDLFILHHVRVIEALTDLSPVLHQKYNSFLSPHSV